MAGRATRGWLAGCIQLTESPVRAGSYQAVQPPSTSRFWPVT